MRRLGTLPLEAQPGQRWLYHVGADVLGVLVARADRAIAGGRADRPGARPARDGRHAVLRARRLARPLRRRLRHRPGLGRALDVRRAGRSVEPAAGVPVRRCRAGVDDRRLPRVRADAPSRRAPRGHADRPGRAGGRDDDEPAHAGADRGQRPRRVGRPGVRVLRRRPRCATPPMVATRAPTGGAAASGATGTRTPSTTRSASCSPTRCSTAPSCRRSARSCSGRDAASRASRWARIAAADCSGGWCVVSMSRASTSTRSMSRVVTKRSTPSASVHLWRGPRSGAVTRSSSTSRSHVQAHRRGSGGRSPARAAARRVDDRSVAGVVGDEDVGERRTTSPAGSGRRSSGTRPRGPRRRGPTPRRGSGRRRRGRRPRGSRCP